MIAVKIRQLSTHHIFPISRIFFSVLKNIKYSSIWTYNGRYFISRLNEPAGTYVLILNIGHEVYLSL